MKKLLLALLLVLIVAVLSSCELTIAKSTTSYDKKTNTIKKTTTILPDLDDQLTELFGK